MRCKRCAQEAKDGRRFCQACLDRSVVANRELRAKRQAGGLCYWCGQRQALPGIKACAVCRTRDIQRRLQLRAAAITHYGGVCACCGEPQQEFLQLDHPGGGGCQHRRQLQAQGTTLWLWLKKHNYPPGFRVLCANCNAALGFYGYCPHQRGAQRA